MTDKLIVEGLRLNATVGVNRWEKAAPQIVAVDLEIAVDAAAAAAADRISATVDYKRVTRDIAAVASARPFELVETLAEEIAALILGDHGASRVKVAVRKPWALRHVRDVGVVIERGK